MDETADRPKFSRFTKHIVLASIFGGALSVTPGLAPLDLLLCLPSVSGIVLALWMYLRANPGDKVSLREAAGFGAIAGTWAGLAIGVLVALLWGATKMVPVPADDPDMGILLVSVGTWTSTGAFFVILSVAVSSSFGALGAMLGMRLFFGPRIRKP